MTKETQEVASLVISCLAFLVSGVALGWTIFRDVIDKGRLRITLQIARLVPTTDGRTLSIKWSLYEKMVASGKRPDDGGQNKMVATITNDGRRPIVAAKWGAESPTDEHKGFFILSRDLPKKLDPGDYTSEWTDDLSVLQGNVRYFYVSDSTDRIWKVSRRNLRAVRADAETILARTKGSRK